MVLTHRCLTVNESALSCLFFDLYFERRAECTRYMCGIDHGYEKMVLYYDPIYTEKTQSIFLPILREIQLITFTK